MMLATRKKTLKKLRKILALCASSKKLKKMRYLLAEKIE